MHPEARTEILRRLLASRERGPDVDARPSSVPVERYREPAVLEQERLALFRRQPLLIAHVSELAGPGDFLTEDMAGVPLLVLRDASGQVRVFQNLCRHQGVRLVDEKQGCGRKSFRCLYHAWRYGLDGALMDIAGREIAEAHLYPGLELRAVAHEVRHGFVWVRLDGKPALSPEAGPETTTEPTHEPMPEPTIGVAGFLGPVLDDDFAHFALASHAVHRKNAHVRACNWKLVLDALGAGHPLEPDGRTHVHQEAAVLDDCAPHVRHVSAHPGSLEVAPDVWDLRRDATVSYSVFPGTVLIVHPQSISLISLFPEAVDRVRVVHRMLLASRPADNAERERLDQSFERIDDDALAGEILAEAERLQAALGPAVQPGTEPGTKIAVQPEPQPEPWPAAHGTRLFHQAWERVMSAHVK